MQVLGGAVKVEWDEGRGISGVTVAAFKGAVFEDRFYGDIDVRSYGRAVCAIATRCVSKV